MTIPGLGLCIVDDGRSIVEFIAVFFLFKQKLAVRIFLADMQKTFGLVTEDTKQDYVVSDYNCLVVLTAFILWGKNKEKSCKYRLC